MAEHTFISQTFIYGMRHAGPGATIEAKWYGPDDPLAGTLQIQLGPQGLIDVFLNLTWEQARKLRHQLSVAIEAGIRNGVSVDEAIQRG